LKKFQKHFNNHKKHLPMLELYSAYMADQKAGAQYAAAIAQAEKQISTIKNGIKSKIYATLQTTDPGYVWIEGLIEPFNKPLTAYFDCVLHDFTAEFTTQLAELRTLTAALEEATAAQHVAIGRAWWEGQEKGRQILRAAGYFPIGEWYIESSHGTWGDFREGGGTQTDYIVFSEFGKGGLTKIQIGVLYSQTNSRPNIAPGANV
jgi:hypothetical protein